MLFSIITHELTAVPILRRSTMSNPTRPIEVYRCWSDHTWDTAFVDIPRNTPDDRIAEAAEAAVLRGLSPGICDLAFVGIYHVPEEV
jgi:hypothetical protein